MDQILQNFSGKAGNGAFSRLVSETAKNPQSGLFLSFGSTCAWKSKGSVERPGSDLPPHLGALLEV